MKRKIILHPGYPKTATTTLQDLFYRSNSFYSIGKPKYFDEELRDYLRILKWGTEEDFGHIKFLLSKKLKNISDKCQGKILVISDELFLGTQKEKCKKENYVNNIFLTASRLRKILTEIFEVKVIIGIRRQDNSVISRYSQAQYMGIIEDDYLLDDFIKEGLKNPEIGVFSIMFYLNILEFYQKCFSDIYIMIFEKFQEDPNIVVSEIMKFCGNKVYKNQNFNISSLNSRRKRNGNYIVEKKMHLSLIKLKKKLFPNFKFPKTISKIVLQLMKTITRKKLKIYMNESYRKKIIELYSDDNKKLDDRFNLNLKKYDYYS